MVKENDCCCGHGGHGWIALIVGLLILVNALWDAVSWPVFVGMVIALIGLTKLLMTKK